jgi:hypothetical protein
LGCILSQCLHFVAFLHFSIHAFCLAAARSDLLIAVDVAAGVAVAADEALLNNSTSLFILSLFALIIASSCLVCHLVRFSTNSSVAAAYSSITLCAYAYPVALADTESWQCAFACSVHIKFFRFSHVWIATGHASHSGIAV